MMNKIKNVISLIKIFSPYLITVGILKTIIIALLPFINIIFMSKLVDILIYNCNEENKIIVFYTIIIVSIVNAILLVCSKILEDVFEKKKIQLQMEEKKKIIDSLCTMDYEILEQNITYNYIQKYKDAIDRYKTVFGYLIDILIDLFYGILTIVLSAVLVFPLFINTRNVNDSFFASNWFTLIITFVIVVAVLMVFFISQVLSKKWNKYTDENVKLNKLLIYFSDLVTNYKVGKDIRIFNSSKFIKDYATSELITKGTKLQKDIANSSAKSSSVIAVIGGIIGCGVYLFIGIRGMLNLFSIGKVVLYTGIFMKIVNTAIKTASSCGKLITAVKPIETYNYLVSDENQKKYGTIELDDKKNIEIVFENVSFKYDKDADYVLKNINLVIHSNEKIAIVGKNGSGKTTLIKLLCGLYKVDQGRILINGIDLKDLSKSSYLKIFSTVFQDFSIFSLPLYENICADSNYDLKRLIECLNYTDMYLMVKNMPDMEKTHIYKHINEDGVEISGGEAQKIAIARAFYKDAPVMIFDEPTAALDPAAEMEIYKNFNKIINDRTTIYISHRLSSCVFCERIIVLDNGTIIEEGQHSELLNKSKGIYREMWETQAKHYT